MGEPVSRATPPVPAKPPVKRGNWLGLSLVWLIPLIAVIAASSVAVRSYLGSGPEITIGFQTADGLEPGKTEIRYKEVTVGRLRTVRFSPGNSHVIAVVDLTRAGANFAVTDTQFWVVRPRIGVNGISGITTLLSGAYIDLDAGTSNQKRTNFDGLEIPPAQLHGERGRDFLLHAADLGSLDYGSPVYFHQVNVGRVVRYALDPDGKGVTVRIFVEQPFSSFVTTATRFWNAGGIDLTLDANGLKLQTQSLSTIVLGGIAFGSDPTGPAAPVAKVESSFTLFSNEAAAMARPDTGATQVMMRFDQSVRGLEVGAPLDFLGVTLGSVTSVSVDYDASTRRFPVMVAATLYPSRLGPAFGKATADAPAGPTDAQRFLQSLIQAGLQAQMRTASLLTGQVYIALDFPSRTEAQGTSGDKNRGKAASRGADQNTVQGPDQPTTAAPAQTDAGPVEIPTVSAGTLDELQPQLVDIVRKINTIPFNDIGRNLNGTLTGLGAFIRDLSPEARKSLADVQKSLDDVNRNLLDENAPAQRNLNLALEELQRAAQSIHALTDYLERHPESLIQGKPSDASQESR